MPPVTTYINNSDIRTCRQCLYSCSILRNCYVYKVYFYPFCCFTDTDNTNIFDWQVMQFSTRNATIAFYWQVMQFSARNATSVFDWQVIVCRQNATKCIWLTHHTNLHQKCCYAYWLHGLSTPHLDRPINTAVLSRIDIVSCNTLTKHNLNFFLSSMADPTLSLNKKGEVVRLVSK